MRLRNRLLERGQHVRWNDRSRRGVEALERLSGALDGDPISIWNSGLVGQRGGLSAVEATFRPRPERTAAGWTTARRLHGLPSLTAGALPGPGRTPILGR